MCTHESWKSDALGVQIKCRFIQIKHIVMSGYGNEWTCTGDPQKYINWLSSEKLEKIQISSNKECITLWNIPAIRCHIATKNDVKEE